MRDINNINLNKARKGKIYDTEFTERSVCAYATEKSVKFDCLSYELKSIIETITKNALNMNNASKNCMALMVYKTLIDDHTIDFGNGYEEMLYATCCLSYKNSEKLNLSNDQIFQKGISYLNGFMFYKHHC